MSIPEGGSTSVSAVSRDVDEARALGGQIYYPHSVRVLGDSQQFSMRLDAAEMGPVTMGWLSYDTEVKIETGDLGDAYHVNLPVTGQLKTGSGADRVIATPSRAAIYRADRGSVLEGWGNDPCRMLAVKIDRRASRNNSNCSSTNPSVLRSRSNSPSTSPPVTDTSGGRCCRPLPINSETPTRSTAIRC